jgi:N-methylhydantoinase B
VTAADGEIAIDPVALRIVHNRLETLMGLMSDTIRRLTGSSVVREGGDMSTAYIDANGRLVAFGAAVSLHLGHEVLVVRWINDHVDRETIRAGDIFLSNDPFTGGAVHASDVGVVAPVFVDEALIGWVFADMHFTDVGGMLPGSFAPDAIDVYGESIRFPPTRIADARGVREDVLAAFVNNVRSPNDTRKNIAVLCSALTFGMGALQKLAREYGVRRFGELAESLQQFSEAKMRDRIAEIPDGVYEAADYIEDGYQSENVYRASLRMSVRGRDIYLDFRDSSAPAPSLLNCSKSGLIAGSIGPLMQQLASDIPFNAGVTAPIHIRADDSSFINAPAPTPVGMATAYGAWAVQDATLAAMSSALQAAGGRLARQATAQWGGNYPVYCFSGRSDQHGRPVLFFSKDTSGVGQGAMPGLDGSGGGFLGLFGAIPSIEAHEAEEPLLFLSRENWVDGGGPGRWRGGVGLRSAVIVWGAQSGDLSGTFCTGRSAVPPYGLFGGYPAPGVHYGVIRGGRARQAIADGMIRTLTELERDPDVSFEQLPTKCVWHGREQLAANGEDVFVMTHPGGGGMGDPLLREPWLVERDVREGIVSAGAAHDTYGVVLAAAGAAEPAATAERRALLRAGRAPSGAAPASRPAEGWSAEHAVRIGNVLQDLGGRQDRCADCGYVLARAGHNWKEQCSARRVNASERLNRGDVGPDNRVRAHPCVELAELFCPACSALLSVEFYLTNEPYRWSFRTLADARDAGYDAAAEHETDPQSWIEQ